MEIREREGGKNKGGEGEEREENGKEKIEEQKEGYMYIQMFI